MRSFDDGRSFAAPGTPDGNGASGASEYDVATANPRFDAAAAMGLTRAANGGESCDVAEANPGFDPTPYEDAPSPASAPPAPATRTAPSSQSAPTAAPRGQAAAPMRSPAKAAPPSPRTSEASTRANAFTSREVRKLVQDDDFRADLDAILNGASTPPKPRAEAQSAQPRRPAPPAPTTPEPPSIDDAATALSDIPNEHAIFDKIAKNMRYATAYDLASVSLSRRFDSFDRHTPKRPPAARDMTNPQPAAGSTTGAAERMPSAPPRRPPSAPAPAEAEQPSDTGEHRQDTAPFTPQASGSSGPALSPSDVPPPQTLRPCSEAERVASYGDPRPDPAAWAEENIAQVDVPQLVGIPSGEGAPSNGSVAFHRLGARSLADLFAAWETAGLMSKVLTFDNAHVPESPHPGGSAHLWGIAFDVNTEWNQAGAQPAAAGDKGAVRDLVAIANRHGFVWGGHDTHHPAGLHFELGHRN
ncbi:M15 family metallopeptidase [Thetidibacter halocola]|uniref:M15 family metallopeptidase n=1 Tax=Thetidibacter halocola TaxID=2827239 RepID=A0A8J8B8Y2_9RHOB|nr:M15 family metallopeptidase [Thetidibacter halocola]MBS0124995.1 M15 family metallopeptidase [Thetidibacter halocola]